MSIAEYLRNNEFRPVPDWLAQAQPGMTFPRDEFFRSRVLYYPGGYIDGQPVRLFASSHAVHCFVYVDFSYTRDQLMNVLDCEVYGFRGYQSLARLDVQQKELRATPWNPPPIRLDYRGFADRAMACPFAVLEILQRKPDLRDDHGPERLAILLVAGCGFASFHALFTQSEDYRPFAITLQDHGFSGNPDHFGEGGLLSRLAREHDKRPKYLLVAENTPPWRGYRRLENLRYEYGGGHFHRRFLYLEDPSFEHDDLFAG
jgi:hypothetical protein